MESLMQSNKTDWEKIYENRMETGKTGHFRIKRETWRGMRRSNKR